MTRIEQLESELNKKIHELNSSLNAQYFLQKQLIASAKMLEEVESQFKRVEVFLKYSNQYIYKLNHENEKLKLASDEWMKRAINLEFKVLSTRNAAKE